VYCSVDVFASVSDPDHYTVRHGEMSPRSPLISNLSLPLWYFLSFATKRKEAGAGKSKNCLNSPNEMKARRAMLPRTSLPHRGKTHIYTTPEGIRALMSSSLCVSVSASLCLSQPCNLMSNRVGAHTTGLRERGDESAFLQVSSLHLSP